MASARTRFNPFTWGLAVLVSALLLGPVGARAGLECTSQHPSLQSVSLPRALPLGQFYLSRGKRWGYQLSPDGDQLLWIELVDGVATVRFNRIGRTLRRSIHGTSPIRWAYWAADSRHVVAWRDTRGDENYRPWVADTAAPKNGFRQLVDGSNVRVFFQQQLTTRPLELLVRHNRRDAAVPDLYRLDVLSGTETLIERNPGTVDCWVTDRVGRPILRRHRHADFSWTLESATGDGWRNLVSGRPDEYFEPQGHPLPGSSFVWALSNRGRDRIGLVKFDLRSGDESLLFEHPLVDVSNVLLDADSYQPMLAMTWPDYQDTVTFHPDVATVLKRVNLGRPAAVTLTSWSDDKRRFVATVEGPQIGRRSVLVDAAKRKPEVLSPAPIGQHGAKLATVRPIRFQARDGLEINGYLTSPPRVNGHRLPAVVLVHGGPFSRDRWGYHALDQLLSNRGYVVLRVNYRGSIGYGRDFLEAARGEFGRKMQDDLVDGANWLVDNAIADAESIAVYGQSYGGYAALMALTRTPTFFAAGISLMGPADLAGVIESGPAYWRLYRPYWFRFIGDPDNASDRLEMASRSPINYVERIERPLLVAHGANDVRVARQQSEQVVNALRARGADVEYLLLEGEGHSIRTFNNLIRLAAATERFLGKHLGGRVCQLKGVRMEPGADDGDNGRHRVREGDSQG